MLKKQQKEIERLRYLREKYRDLINNRVEEIFDFKKELSAKIAKENLKDTKYVNFDDETYQRLKFIKRVITSMNITTFKIALYEISRRNISAIMINIFINFKSNNKYLDVKKFHDIKDNKFYET